MNSADKIVVSRDQNPKMWEVWGEKQLGDKGVIESHVTLDSRDTEQMVFRVDAHVPEGYELDDDTPPETGPSPGEAMVTSSAYAVKKKNEGK